MNLLKIFILLFFGVPKKSPNNINKPEFWFIINIFLLLLVFLQNNTDYRKSAVCCPFSFSFLYSDHHKLPSYGMTTVATWVAIMLPAMGWHSFC